MYLERVLRSWTSNTTKEELSTYTQQAVCALFRCLSNDPALSGEHTGNASTRLVEYAAGCILFLREQRERTFHANPGKRKIDS